MKTHPEITNPLYRQMLAREMRLIRKIAREQTGDANAEWACDYLNGFETALRRISNTALVEELAQGMKS